jgi:acetyl-CoA C-acetyltransferase
VNKLCLSGLTAMESMSNAEHLLPGSRRGVKYGDAVLLDALDSDELTCGFDGISMGAATERYQAKLGISRDDQDAFAAAADARAAAAIKEGRLAEETAPVAISARKGDTLVELDEGVRPETTADGLAALPPVFGEHSTITAGPASQLSDGACAVVVRSAERAQRLGLPRLAEIGAYGTVAGPDPSLQLQPANAIRDALGLDGTLEVGDLDLVEINEAFAAVALASARELAEILAAGFARVAPSHMPQAPVPAAQAALDAVGLTLDHGCRLVFGHPQAPTGLRSVPELIEELRLRDGGTGLFTGCAAADTGTAILVRFHD